MNNKISDKPSANSKKEMATRPELHHLRIQDNENFVFHSRRITSDDEAADTGLTSSASFEDDTVAYDDNGVKVANKQPDSKNASKSSNNHSNSNTVASVSSEFVTPTTTPDSQMLKQKTIDSAKDVLSFDTSPGEFDLSESSRATKKTKKYSDISSIAKSCSSDTDPASLFGNDIMVKPPVATESPQDVIPDQLCEMCSRCGENCKSLKFGRFCITVVYCYFCENRDSYNEATAVKKFIEAYCIINDYEVFKPKKSIHCSSNKLLPECLEARSLIFALNMMKWERCLLAAQMSAVFL